MQPSELCRICGGAGLFLEIFDEKTSYSEDLEECLAVKVKPNDGRSQVICHKCLGTLSWCKAYVSKVDQIKNDSPSPSNKLCYCCRSAKGHLFSLPEASADNLHKFFGLKVLKPKNSKICHQCQFSLDCVSELREKANTVQKLSRRGQYLQIEVLQKNASVDDLVSSLKDREVEKDAGTPSRKNSRISKNPQPGNTGIRTPKKENGSYINNLDEDDGLKKRNSLGRNVANDKKKSSRHSSPENDKSSAKDSKLKRRRRAGNSSDSDNNSESSPDTKSARLSGNNKGLIDSRRSSCDSNDSRLSDTPKKQAKSKPSPKSKRQKVEKSKKEVASDSDSDSACLASLVGERRTSKSEESVQRTSRKRTPSLKYVDAVSPNSKEKSQERGRRNSFDSGQKQVANKSIKRSEASKTPKKVHFKTNTKKRKHLDDTSRSRKRRGRKEEEEDVEDSSDEEESYQEKKPKHPLQEYTCKICLEDFHSTVLGKRHELSHDERFDKFEIKLVRASREEIASATEKTSKASNVDSVSRKSDGDLDDDDDLWSTSRPSKETKKEKASKENLFDSLFSNDSENQSTNAASSCKDFDSLKSSEKTDVVHPYNSSDSETEVSETPNQEVDHSDKNSEDKTLQDKKSDEDSESKSEKEKSETKKSKEDSDSEEPDEISESKSNEKSDEISESKSNEKPDEISASKSNEKPDEISASKSNEKPDEISESKSNEKPDEISESKSNEKPDEISESDSPNQERGEEEPENADCREDERKSENASVSEKTEVDASLVESRNSAEVKESIEESSEDKSESRVENEYRENGTEKETSSEVVAKENDTDLNGDSAVPSSEDKSVDKSVEEESLEDNTSPKKPTGSHESDPPQTQDLDRSNKKAESPTSKNPSKEDEKNENSEQRQD